MLSKIFFFSVALFTGDLCLACGTESSPDAFSEIIEVFQEDFESAASEHQVPEALLLTLAWEASRFDPTAVSAWGGVGLFGFRPEGQGGLELKEAARLVGFSVAELTMDSRAQVESAAIWLALNADMASIERDAPLEAWGPAIAPFSASSSPVVQDRFTQFIIEAMHYGFESGEFIVAPVIDDFPNGIMTSPPLPVGDYSGSAAFVEASSTNYTAASRAGSDIDIIVIHTVQGSYSGAISWFQNSDADVSAHYVVRSADGEVTQCLWEEDIGWHAGNWSYNERSIGIEHEGYVDDPDQWYTEAMYRSSAILAADIIARTNVTLDRDHIVGHVEVPGATHTDPGTGWDWDRYMEYVEEYVNGGSGENAVLLGVVADSDIYNGARLQDVTVTLTNGSVSTTTDTHGEFRFEDLGVGEWTVSASAQGFIDSECTVEILAGSGEWWCSIALLPVGSDTGIDTSEADGWEHVPIRDVTSGCGCGVSGGESRGLWWLLAPFAAVLRRRRA
jgi:hypothetical protein